MLEDLSPQMPAGPCYPYLRLKHIYLFIYLSFCLFRAAPAALEVPRPGVQSELLLSADARTTATPDLSHVCDLYHSSRPRWILNPLSKARDQTCNLMVASQTCFCCSTMGTPKAFFIIKLTWRPDLKIP